MQRAETLSELGDSYISEKQALGLKFTKNAQIMNRFLQMAEQNKYASPLLERNLVELWCAKTSYETENNHLHRISFIRGFAEYMIRLGYPAYIIPYRTSSYNQNYQPYIFTNEELSKIFYAAKCMKNSKNYTFSSCQFSTIFRLLYSTGMRTSEVFHLRKKDVDLQRGMVLIIEAKFNKERYLPLDATMHVILKEYVLTMGSYQSWNNSDFFFINSAGNPHKDIYHPFRMVLKEAGISHGGRGYGPRVHDLRHTYAVHLLRKWVREGRDLTVALPYLSVYMGHTGIRSSQYYLRLTSDLYPDIIKTLDDNYGWMIPEVQKNENY